MRYIKPDKISRLKKHTLGMASGFYKSARHSMETFQEDETSACMAHNQIHQAMEQLLSYWLVCLGETPYRTHNMVGIVKRLKNLGADFMLDELDAVSKLIEKWDDRVFDDYGFMPVLEDAEKACDFYDKLREYLITTYPPE